MSIAKARKRSADEGTVAAHTHSDRCAAHGCPMRGTIGTGGSSYVCRYHYPAQPEDWPRVTDELVRNERLLLAVNEVLRIGDIEWALGKWEMLERFFRDEPQLQPTDAERQRRAWYLNRLDGWLRYLTGTVPRAPQPRQEITAPKPTRANVFSTLVVRAQQPERMAA